jgi:cell division septum initiation protein DivIVA
MDELKKEIEKLKLENEELKKELQETKEHLKKYTASDRFKTYYERNKEVINQKNKERYLIKKNKI